MVRPLLLVVVVAWAVLACASSASAGGGHEKGAKEPFPGLGFGWTNKYYAVAACPGQQTRPWNPLHAVPVHSSLGQTGARKLMLWPPVVFSPLYSNTPRLVPYPPGARPCPKTVCPY